MTKMKTADAISHILKREGVEYLIGYPVNHVLEHAAKVDIRPIIVRQERTGLHMADAISRVTSGKKIGAFAMQHGPGTENAYGGVAQAYSESVPILVLPMGYSRKQAWIDRNYFASVSMRSITKSAEPITSAADIPNVFRRAFQRLKSGRGGPVLVEIPTDMWNDEVDPTGYISPAFIKSGVDPAAVKQAAKRLVAAKRPVIYAGQGVHWAEAWAELKELAELLAIPVTTSLEGKSAFDETHPLSLGSGGLAIAQAVRTFLDKSDLILGIGCSFTETNFGVKMPAGHANIIQATLDPSDINKDIAVSLGIAGDAKLILGGILDEVKKLHGSSKKDPKSVIAEIKELNEPWLAKWLPKLESNSEPINPYRVFWDLQKTVDKSNTIVTHDAGSPRDQISPFWKATTPLSYLGWGKTTQLGYGLGLAMGAKLAKPEKLCINCWGDAAIGFVGMDFETAARERIPILSILSNNFSMAIELKVMPVSTEKYRSTDISGHYANFAKALGCYGERIEKVSDIVPAIKRGIKATQEGKPALLEFITSKETEVSRIG